MSERLLVRLAPELHRAIRDKADEAGLSMNSWIVHVLAAAVGPSFFRDHDDGGPPRTVAESRMDKWRRERDLPWARNAYQEALIRRGIPLSQTRKHMNDEEALRYYREVYLPRIEAQDTG